MNEIELAARVEELLQQMTLEEKIHLCHGCSGMEAGDIPRLGIPRAAMADGPQGVRLEDGRTATALPSGIALACSWSEETAHAYGALLGREVLGSGSHVSLGPGMNMMRTPLNGRNFEYFGEDPVLAGKIAAAYINGCQEAGAAATPKHLALNNQEICRTTGSSNIEE
ncbi:MAG: glycoside hydrolase family 3 N-terminal domain-containing protein, partial [Victivallales bacterium]|nr:glycoside hydrolase family 3 N-terminal domain-containing protein [Victivallales bacterium]